MAVSKRKRTKEKNAGGGRPIALLTDFGAASMYVGVMHGVIAAQTPDVRVIDLAHDVAPQNVAEAALYLEAAVDYFPSPTVFCCVVDPGVGTARRPLAASDGRHFFIAPDNGLLSLAEQAAREQGRNWEVRLLDPKRIESPGPLSATFHARDVFTPAAAAIARGGTETFHALSDPVDEWATMDAPAPAFDPVGQSVTVNVLAIDSFGNVITTLRRRDWDAFQEEPTRATAGEKEPRKAGGKGAPVPDPDAVEVRLGDVRWRGIARTFGDVAPGEPLAYWGSGGRLEIGVRDGNAATRFSIVRGAPVILLCSVGPRSE